jgi:hypothetical protein
LIAAEQAISDGLLPLQMPCADSLISSSMLSQYGGRLKLVADETTAASTPSI